MITINNPQISIDRASKSFAIFNDGFNCIYGFEPYESEDAATNFSKQWLKDNHNYEGNVEMVYPNITSMKFSTRKVSKKKYA